MTVLRDLELVANIVDRLPDPILLLDGDLRLVRYNPAFIAFSELRTRRLERVLEDAASAFEIVGDPGHAEIARACLASGRPTRLEDVQIQSPSGDKKTAIVAFVPISSLEGEPIGLIYSLRDVSGDVEVHKRYKLLLKKEQDRVKTLEEREVAVMADLEEAKLFQESLLPAPPSIEGIRLVTRFLPAEIVSGDLYDLYPIEDGVRVMVADASGHGIQASLRTMVVKAEYDQIKKLAVDPGELLSVLNDRFVASYSRTHLHFTLCCFDIVRMLEGHARIRCASAGHPGLLRLSGGGISEIRAPGPFPGLLPEVEFSTMELDLAPGDRLLAFTDGFIEQARADGSQLDEQQIRSLLDCGLAIDELIDRVLGQVTAFLGEEPLSDDITVVGIEID